MYQPARAAAQAPPRRRGSGEGAQRREEAPDPAKLAAVAARLRPYMEPPPWTAPVRVSAEFKN